MENLCPVRFNGVASGTTQILHLSSEKKKIAKTWNILMSAILEVIRHMTSTLVFIRL